MTADPDTPTPRWLRNPLFFPVRGGGLDIFIDASSVTFELEAIDVLNGEWGPHGWDADGWRIEMIVTQPPPRPPGLLARLLGDGSSPDDLRSRGRVELRPLAGPPEREVLRQVILAELRDELDPEAAAELESAPLAQLVELVRHRAD